MIYVNYLHHLDLVINMQLKTNALKFSHVVSFIGCTTPKKMYTLLSTLNPILKEWGVNCLEQSNNLLFQQRLELISIIDEEISWWNNNDVYSWNESKLYYNFIPSISNEVYGKFKLSLKDHQLSDLQTIVSYLRDNL